MPSREVEEFDADPSASEELARCASLVDGLHALAQPLTILRASIVAASAAETTQEKQRHYLEISKSQVERACGLFDSLQDIVIAAQDRAERTPIDRDEQRELP